MNDLAIDASPSHHQMDNIFSGMILAVLWKSLSDCDSMQLPDSRLVHHPLAYPKAPHLCLIIPTLTLS